MTHVMRRVTRYTKYQMTSDLTTLTKLPFVTQAKRTESGTASQVRLRTPDGVFTLAVVTVPARAGTGSVDRAMNCMREQGVDASILLAPSLSRPVIHKLIAGKYNFADEQGNCNLGLDGRYIATLVGFGIAKRDPSPDSASDSSIAVAHEQSPGTPRAPGYQVLFAFLAQADLLTSTLRDIATASGASTQAVIHMLDYLASAGWIEGKRASRQWSPEGRSAALDMWVRGYAEKVRTRMRPQVFRTPHEDPSTLRRRLKAALKKHRGWRWHGDAAANRIMPYYEGQLTCILASDDLTAALTAALKNIPAMPARHGDLVVMTSFSPCCLAGASPDTVHPLMIYAELSSSPDPRSQESARLLLAEGLVS